MANSYQADKVQVGTRIRRLLGGSVPMDLTVSRLTEDTIECDTPDGLDHWTFDRKTGAEIDDDLEWGPAYGRTGSYLSEILDAN